MVIAASSASTHETPSGDGSSSSSNSEEHDLPQNIQNTASATDTEKLNVDLDELIKQILGLLELYKKKSPRDKTPHGTLSRFKEFENCWKQGIKFVDDLKESIPSKDSTAVVRRVLEGIGHANVATAGLLLVANIIKRFEDISRNQMECLDVLEGMTKLAEHVKLLKERPRLKKEMEDTNKKATDLIEEAYIMCSSQMNMSLSSKLFSTQSNKRTLKKLQKELQEMYGLIGRRMGICLYDVILDRDEHPSLPRAQAYPEFAVGIEKQLEEVFRLLDSERESNAVAVMLHGFGGMGKTTLADAVFASVNFEDCKYSMVRLFDDITSAPNIVELQKCILQDLMRQTDGEKKPIPDIRTFEGGQREIGVILEKEPVFIYIDNAFHRDALEQLLPRDATKAKYFRLLITARDKYVLSGYKHLKKKVYLMKCLEDEEAEKLLKKEMHNEIDELNGQIKDLVGICGGIPRLLISVARFISFEEDKQKAYRTIIEDKEKLTGQFLGDIEHYVFAYDSLPEMCKDPFLDICAFFKGWDWNTVADIVGNSALDMLEKRALVTKATNMTLSVHDVILAIGNKKGYGSRFIITDANQMKELLDKDMHGIKGLWFKVNKDPLDIPATKLDSVYDSLRILALGNFTKVNKRCTEKFEKLLFFQGEVPDLPFDVSHLKELRYLDFQPQDWNLFKKMQSNLRHMKLNGKGLFDVSSCQVDQLQHLRVLKLVAVKDVTKLLDQLGNLRYGLQELILSYCSCLEEISGSISKFQNLKLLKINHGSNMFPKNLTLLKYLQKLNIIGFESLKMSLSLDVYQWKRVIFNEKGCENLKMYLRSLDVSQWKRVLLNEEDCESDRVYVPKWKTLLLNEHEGCESVKVYVDSVDIFQWITLQSNEDEGCESVKDYVDSLEFIRGL